MNQTEFLPFLQILEKRFHAHLHRHPEITWQEVEAAILDSPDKWRTLQRMEETGGEPDVVGYQEDTRKYIICDCAPESPKGRRSACYDQAAREARKENKPATSCLELAEEIGIQLLSEDEYKRFQIQENWDKKTSSWLLTPPDIRQKGGAVFGDWRYGHIFVYHNGADSYYASRGFRGYVLV